ncbi:hypothetical protein JNM05_10645 [bacterium]|nr:hypothetical protein [bacterium]
MEFNFLKEDYKSAYEELYVWFIKYAGGFLARLRKETKLQSDLNAFFIEFLYLDYNEKIRFYDQKEHSLLIDKVYASSFPKSDSVSKRNLVVIDCPIYILALVARELNNFGFASSNVDGYKKVANNFRIPREELSWKQLQSVISTYGMSKLEGIFNKNKTRIETTYKTVLKTLKNRKLV